MWSRFFWRVRRWVMGPEAGRCYECGAVQSATERHYYGSFCEACERRWFS